MPMQGAVTGRLLFRWMRHRCAVAASLFFDYGLMPMGEHGGRTSVFDHNLKPMEERRDCAFVALLQHAC